MDVTGSMCRCPCSNLTLSLGKAHRGGKTIQTLGINTASQLRKPKTALILATVAVIVVLIVAGAVLYIRSIKFNEP